MKARPVALITILCIMWLFVAAAVTLGGVQEVTGQPTPAGEAVMAWPVTISPTWFDPSTAPPQITPFGMLYALHDALIRPLPGQKMGNSLAESDGLTYEFKLRRGLKFHNGDPVTAEDVKLPMEVIPTSTNCCSNRPASGTPRSAKSCSIASSNSRSTG